MPQTQPIERRLCVSDTSFAANFVRDAEWHLNSSHGFEAVRADTSFGHVASSPKPLPILCIRDSSEPGSQISASQINQINHTFVAMQEAQAALTKAQADALSATSALTQVRLHVHISGIDACPHVLLAPLKSQQIFTHTLCLATQP